MNYEINIKNNNYKNDNIIQKSSKYYGRLNKNSDEDISTRNGTRQFSVECTLTFVVKNEILNIGRLPISCFYSLLNV